MFYHLKPGAATAIQCIVIVFHYVMCKLHEQRLITKEHIATHINLILRLYAIYVYTRTPIL